MSSSRKTSRLLKNGALTCHPERSEGSLFIFNKGDRCLASLSMTFWFFQQPAKLSTPVRNYANLFHRTPGQPLTRPSATPSLRSGQALSPKGARAVSLALSRCAISHPFVRSAYPLTACGCSPRPLGGEGGRRPGEGVHYHRQRNTLPNF